MKTQRHEWVTTTANQVQFFFWFLSQSSWGKQAGTQTERETQTHRESQSFSSGVVVGWVLLVLLFSFFFFWFWWNCPTSLFSSCQSDKEEQAGQEEAWRKWGGKGREGKGREGREGKGSVCQSENFWFLQAQRGVSNLSIFSGNWFKIVRVLTWGLESLECFFWDFLGWLSFQRKEFFN